ncbi:MAG: TetR/AcrR family transcriptional regulator [Dehalococcoidales bacterium]|jgi:AcrR family transcriptional regulator
MKTEEYSLREKKHAKTKIAIMNAFMEKLKRDRFDDISIREICRDAEVAEGTFFNYFPEKIDVIGYFLCLTNLKMIWKARRGALKGRYLNLIESLFSQIPSEINNSNVICQVLSVLILKRERPKKIAVSNLEKKLAFPGCAGIEDVPLETLDEWFKRCVVSAQKNGELPARIRAEDVVISLITILTGTLLSTRLSVGNDCGNQYTRQLYCLWRGLGVKGTKEGCIA